VAGSGVATFGVIVVTSSAYGESFSESLLVRRLLQLIGADTRELV